MPFSRKYILSLFLAITLILPKNLQAQCFEEAGAMYGISPLLLWSIAKGESEFNSHAVGWNSNGTYDYGLMQINSSWAPVLKKHGISWESLADPCTNVKVGAWILSQCIRQYGYNWAGVGCYNSRTPSKRNKYANKIFKIVKQTSQQMAQNKLTQPVPVIQTQQPIANTRFLNAQTDYAFEQSSFQSSPNAIPIRHD